jgi:hypothetical protein
MKEMVVELPKEVWQLLRSADKFCDYRGMVHDIVEQCFYMGKHGRKTVYAYTGKIDDLVRVMETFGRSTVFSEVSLDELWDKVERSSEWD